MAYPENLHEKPSRKFGLYLGLFFLCLFGSEGLKAGEFPLWEADVNVLLQQLQGSETGRELISKALRHVGETKIEKLKNWVSAGEVSVTDTVLTRSYSHATGKMQFDEQSQVSINRNLSTQNALLDLAHELTHFIYRKSFNPYSDEFTWAEFIKETIEGTGGEAHAFQTECQVALELHAKKMVDDQEYLRCKPYLIRETDQVKISRNLIIREFYALGRWYPRTIGEFESANLLRSFPLLKASTSKFISAAAGMPYPLAAYYEYKNVKSRACKNEYRRLETLKGHLEKVAARKSKESRRLASADREENDLEDQVSNLQSSLVKRCQGF